MSNSCWIPWIEQLLFGVSSTLDFPHSHPPPELKNLILRMEAENIPWQHILYQGGFTALPYQVHGDLNYLTDYLEKQWLFQNPFHEPLPFKTRAVSKFWIELQMLLSKRDATPLPVLPTPSTGDDAILKDLLELSHSGPHTFQSATFWGEVARRFIHLRRPETRSVFPTSPNTSTETSSLCTKRLKQLYDITCMGRGQCFDPFHLNLVHHSEYVNAAHWQTSKNLEAFMVDRPSHALTLSIQTLLKRTVEEVLNGEKPSAFLKPCQQLDAFLYNVRVMDESVEKVMHENTPPKLIDIFQRLLALCYRDKLWEKNIPVLEPSQPVVGTSVFYLTEQLRIAERERRVLWKHTSHCFTTNDEGSGPELPSRICSDFLYARDTPRRTIGEREHPNFQR